MMTFRFEVGQREALKTLQVSACVGRSDTMTDYLNATQNKGVSDVSDLSCVFGSHICVCAPAYMRAHTCVFNYTYIMTDGRTLPDVERLASVRKSVRPTGDVDMAKNMRETMPECAAFFDALIEKGLTTRQEVSAALKDGAAYFSENGHEVGDREKHAAFNASHTGIRLSEFYLPTAEERADMESVRRRGQKGRGQ